MVSLFTIRAAAGSANLVSQKSSMQELRRMVIGAAGAPGQLADRVPRRGGESVTIPHPRTGGASSRPQGGDPGMLRPPGTGWSGDRGWSLLVLTNGDRPH